MVAAYYLEKDQTLANDTIYTARKDGCACRSIYSIGAGYCDRLKEQIRMHTAVVVYTAVAVLGELGYAGYGEPLLYILPR